jgi:endogenous inhibitor of DNA gyrase (YacG/DUF329 family)
MIESTPGPKCPICRKPTVAAYRPFCSKRCADVDLNRWLSGAYVVPGKQAEDEDGEAVPASKDEPGA